MNDSIYSPGPGYTTRIRQRSRLRFLAGILVRAANYFILSRRIASARRRGARIGKDTVIPRELAGKSNSNLRIGCHTLVTSADIDLRSPVVIGDHVIIGQDVRIFTASHDIDDPEFATVYCGCEIEDYAWIATGAVILPRCRRIGRGAVVGAFAVVSRDVPPLAVVVGNPACEVKTRRCVHDRLVVESLNGYDFHEYWNVSRMKK